MTAVDDVDELLVALVRERTGLDFDGCHRARMVRALARAVETSGAATTADLAEALRRDEGAYEALIDQLTVGETYFFREPEQLALVTGPILRDRADGGRSGLRVWSAGCATGEEPYSVAIALDEAGVLDGSEIVGSDISASAIRRAMEARYGRWSLRRCADARRRRCFEAEDCQVRLDERYRRAVTWHVGALLDGAPSGTFDVVLCRNVLLYVTPAAVVAAAGVLHDALAPGGWLLVGASDPLLEHPGLECSVLPQGIVYRRSTSSDRPSWSRPHAPPIHPLPVAAAARRRRWTGSAQGHAPGPPPVPVAARSGARERLLAATHHLDAGRTSAACRDARAAIYLDPDVVLAHLLLARCEQAAGRDDHASRSIRNALTLLGRLPDDVEVDGTGERAGSLRVVLLAELARSEVRA